MGFRLLLSAFSCGDLPGRHRPAHSPELGLWQL
jgi:hypothetical protein